MAALFARANGVVTYTPNRKFKGADSFTYVVGDDSGTNEGRVRVTVRNGVPAAGDDDATTGRNRPVDIDVLDNDADPNGDDLTITETTTPADGHRDRRQRYRHLHPGGRVLRGRHLRLHRHRRDGLDTATVTVAVTNRAPDAVDDEPSTGRNRPVTIEVLANDSDPDGDTLTVTGTTTPADGTVDAPTTAPSPTPRLPASPAPTPSPTRHRRDGHRHRHGDRRGGQRRPGRGRRQSVDRPEPAGRPSPCWPTTPTPTATR